jgi:lambda repressor-like predicted transcriptional regulator
MARAKISSARLSQETGIATSTLSRKLNGAFPFTTDELEVVAEALGVAPSQLFPAEDAK